MNELFKAMFIDRNPAYPLFRHWYRQVEALPEEPSETEDATPADRPVAPAVEPSAPPKQTPEVAPIVETEAKPVRFNPWVFNGALLIGLVLVIGGLLSLAGSGSLNTFLAAILPETASNTVDMSENDPTPILAVSDTTDDSGISAAQFSDGRKRIS